MPRTLFASLITLMSFSLVMAACGGGSTKPECGDFVCDADETCSSCATDCGACPGECGDGTCDSDEDCTSCPADCGGCDECGDGTCDDSEDCATCTADCGACATCGDGTCDATEDCSNCPADCGACATCGDGTCDDSEDCATCPADCGVCPTCGDGTCDPGEDCTACPADCGVCPWCGDGTCDDPDEDCTNCEDDCGPCFSCGDGTCNDPDEDCMSCVTDCGVCPGICGDSLCDASEDCAGCPADCGACPFCGDGICQLDEDCLICEADCGACPGVCGDGVCDPTEDCVSCFADCGACPVCGDGDCEGLETCANCELDCGTCPDVCGDGDCDPSEGCDTCPLDCGNCPAEDCENGIDDDLDGHTDCSDTDCTGYPTCIVTGDTCQDAVDCSHACDMDDVCISVCLAATCPSALEFYDPVWSCLLTNCPQECFSGGSQNECTQCMMVRCIVEANPCISHECNLVHTETSCEDGYDNDDDGYRDCADGDCATYPTCIGAGDNCAEIDACVLACTSDTCRVTCIAAGCPSGQAVYNNYMNCVNDNCSAECQNNGPLCQGCIADRCPGQRAICDANDCSPLAEINCWDGNDNDWDGATDCADSDCEFYSGCLPAHATCQQMLECGDACNWAPCGNDCRLAGCLASQLAYDPLWNCVFQFCLETCETDPDHCLECRLANCANEAAVCSATDCGTATTEIDCTNGIDDDGDTQIDCNDGDCNGHPSCGQVGDTCMEIWDCANFSCGWMVTCVDGCLSTGCPSGQSAFNDLWNNCVLPLCAFDCISDPDSCLMCVEVSCGSEWNACLSNNC